MATRGLGADQSQGGADGGRRGPGDATSVVEGYVEGEGQGSSFPPPVEWLVQFSSEIGGRPRQEDRFYSRPRIPVGDHAEASFFGVWDGTVNPHASDFVHTRCCDHHLQSWGFQAYADLAVSIPSPPPMIEVARCLSDACKEGYAATDAEVIESCRQLANHYSSTTSVSALIASNLLTVAHLGDSRAMLLIDTSAPGTRGGWQAVRGVQLTKDHKPDDPEERRRIEASGGSIQLLHHHNMKPFIRGGDFDRRKATGERVMQLQYSRAFGGKDLKPYGLSAEPSIRQVALSGEHVGLVLASDGVCDVASADDVATVVAQAWERGEDAAQALVFWALGERERCGVGNDNVTAIVVRFRAPGKAQAADGKATGRGLVQGIGKLNI